MMYRAFGLGVWTSQVIPRLGRPVDGGRIDIRIEVAQQPAWFSPSMPVRPRYESTYREPDGQPALVVTELENGWLHLVYSDGTRFWLEPKGSEVWVTWADGLTLQDMSSYLLGPVMGLVLRLRGRVCLHASALVVNGQAVVIVGRSGAGKSTTAAALGARGYPVLADDVVALDDRDGLVHAFPGYPRLRLWPSALGFLARSSPSLPDLPFSSDENRYHLDVTEHGYTFQAEALPLAAIYVLDERSARSDAPPVQPVVGEACLMLLVAHSFTNALLDRTMRAQELDLLSRVASSIGVMRVTPHESPARLSNLCDVILADAQGSIANHGPSVLQPAL